MKRLREIVFEDSSSSEEEEDDEDFETILDMIFNGDVRHARRGLQFGRIHINHDREEGLAKIMRDYFAPNPTCLLQLFMAC